MVAEELYILKHKDLDVAMVKINTFSGRNLLQEKHPEVFETACEILLSVGMRNWKRNSNCQRVWKKSELYSFCQRAPII